MKCTVYKINIKNVHTIDFNNTFFFGLTADKQLLRSYAEIYFLLYDLKHTTMCYLQF